MKHRADRRIRHVALTVLADVNIPLAKFPVVKNRHYVAFGPEVTGKAPKQIVKIYVESVRQFLPEVIVSSSKQRWIPFIAKTGERFYPIESITEHLFTRIGQTLGLEMAETALAVLRGQLRLISRIFVPPAFAPNRKQQLMHGAEVLTAYLDGDRPFVETITKHNKKQASSVIYIDDIFNAISHVFPHHASELIRELSKVLLFDAWTGCLDRHLYNWGVVRGIDDAMAPRFAPIYDTARGLFWRHKDGDLLRKFVGENGRLRREKYIREAKPELGVPGSEVNCSHIEMFSYLMRNCDNETRRWASTTFSDQNRTFVCEMIEREFGRTLSPVRIQAIVELLHDRHSLLSQFY
ncbi:MAG: HipA domain-containing protein [Bacteroidetes bacterium]|nr:HipA domain-containing protein [Bacteroidota bacterium]